MAVAGAITARTGVEPARAHAIPAPQANGHDDAPSPDDIPGFEPPIDQLVGVNALTSRAGTAYNDSWRGWPVAPTRQQHPVRGSFNDPRPTRPPHAHFGVDISVDDARPAPGHPRGRAHRVYAVESGRVQIPPRNGRAHCNDKKLQVGHFSYWHTDWAGSVIDGQYVRAGQQIGWTCKTAWHVHLSEWQWRNGRREWVNPLRPGGKLAPHRDFSSPIIHDIQFYAPTPVQWKYFRVNKRVYADKTGRRLDPSRLRGSVDMRAWIGDVQPKRGWYLLNRPLHAELHPHGWDVTVRNRRTGRVVLRRTYRNDRLLSQPLANHYAPGTRQNLPAALAVKLAGTTRGDNEYWFRMFSNGRNPYWNTRTVPNGWYDISVVARDEKGNKARAHRTVRVRN